MMEEGDASKYFKSKGASSSRSSGSTSNLDSTYKRSQFLHHSLSTDPTLAGNKNALDTSMSVASTTSVSSVNDRSSFKESVRKNPNVTQSSVGHKASNLDNSSVFGDVNHGCVVAVIEGRKSARGEVGLASISITSPTLILCQFSDTRTYVRTLTKIAALNPADILIPNDVNHFGNDAEGNRLYESIVDKFPTSNVTQIHRKYFSETRGLQMVKHLCAPEFVSVELQLLHKFYALSATSCLLKYLEFMENILFAPKSLKIEFQASINSMIIDVDTAKHVELLAPSIKTKSSASLFGILKKCTTGCGTKLLRVNLFQPPTKESLIEDRLDAVSELIERPEVLSTIQSTLGRFADLDSLLSLCAIVPKSDSISTVEQRINQIIALKHTLELLPNLITSLNLEIHASLLQEILQVLEDEAYPLMLEQIVTVISKEAHIVKSSAAMKLQRCFAIRDGINGLLDVARKTYCDLVIEMEKLVKDFAQEQGLPIRVGFNATRGYHMQVQKSFLTQIKGRNFKIKQLPEEFINPKMCKSMITFTTEALIRADQQSQTALREISLMSNVIIQELICDLRGRIGALYKLADAVSHLDLLAAFADVSQHPGFARPRFCNIMCVKESQHPILSHMDMPGDIVSNDVVATPLEANFHVLTGPNMSGKSTYLKQIVLLQIMAQCGCFIPASNDPQPVFRLADSIFSRVSMSDSIESNSSTFAMEMKETAYILNSLGSTSIVIMDELGRGTSPDEGAALCWAISEAFAKTSAFTFLATHFSLMTKMQEISLGVLNHSFVTELNMQDHDLVHTHKLVRGHHELTTLANYGVHLATRLHFPRQVIDRAHAMIQVLQSNDKVAAEVSEEDVMKMNYLRLFVTLKKLAQKEDMEMSDKLEVARNLQRQFSSSQDDDADASIADIEDID